MYGTVARMRIKAGQEEKMLQTMRDFEKVKAPGFVSSYVYRLDSGDNEYILAVVFKDKASYQKNAESPEQDARYKEYRALLETEPQWSDGEIVYPNGI